MSDCLGVHGKHLGAGSTSVALLSHDDAARACPLAIEVPGGRALAQSSAGLQPRRPHRERASHFGYPGRSDERLSGCVNRSLVWCEYGVYRPYRASMLRAGMDNDRPECGDVCGGRLGVV